MQQTKNVFASIVGIPNVGKSTLINRFMGARIAITAPRPQTTRGRIMGVLTRDDIQYVFMDTPGFHEPRTKLGEHMVQAVRGTYQDVDVVLFVVFPKYGFDEEEKKLLSELEKEKVPTILVLNKADTLSSVAKGERMLEGLKEAHPFEYAVSVSAKTGKGIDELMNLLVQYGSEGPHLFDEDTLTDQTEKAICSEIIREKLLQNLYDELPHGCAVLVERFQEPQGEERTEIDAVILCEKDSHKGMIIGKNGAMIKKIRKLARQDIEETLDRKISLNCVVKVRPGWRNDISYLREFGYKV